MSRLHLPDRGSGRLLREMREYRQAIVDELASRVDKERDNPTQLTSRLFNQDSALVRVAGPINVPPSLGPVGSDSYNPYIVPNNGSVVQYFSALRIPEEHRRT